MSDPAYPPPPPVYSEVDQNVTPSAFSQPPPPYSNLNLYGTGPTSQGPPSSVKLAPLRNQRVHPSPFAATGSYSSPTAGQLGTSSSTSRADRVPNTAIISASFSDEAIRRGFIRKVYLILAAQLVFTFGIVCIFSFVWPVKNFIQNETAGMVLYYVSIATFIVTIIILYCAQTFRRKTPWNYICLGIFTLAFSYLLGTISSFYDTTSVLIAAAVTTAVCVSVSAFAIQTKIDLTTCSMLLFVIVFVLLYVGVSCIVVHLVIPYRILDCVWGGIAALLMALFLAYDTQQIVGRNRKYELNPEEYVYGALNLYLDIGMIFILLLCMMGKSS